MEKIFSPPTKTLGIDYLLLTHGPTILIKSGFFGILQFCRGVFVGATLFIYIFLILERALASIMYMKYEKWENIFVIIVPTIVSFWASVAMCFSMVSGEFYI
jgi:hypothetical protein